MKYTNKFNLPQSVYNAVTRDEYDHHKNAYSCTELLKSPCEILLNRRHADEIEEDISESFYSVLGTAVHSIMEKTEEGESEIREERLFMEFPEGAISGKFDSFDATPGAEVLRDYKCTSTWTAIYGDGGKYRKQLLVYLFLIDRTLNIHCRHAQIIQFFRDHSMSKAKFDKSYPQSPIRVLDYYFTDEEIDAEEENIRAKLAEINALKDTPDDELSPCSAENRWETPTTYAVKKDGRKSALRVLSSKEEAELWMEMNDAKGCYIEERKGESRKCANYCKAAPFCRYFRENVDTGGVV